MVTGGVLSRWRALEADERAAPAPDSNLVLISSFSGFGNARLPAGSGNALAAVTPASRLKQNDQSPWECRVRPAGPTP